MFFKKRVESALGEIKGVLGDVRKEAVILKQTIVFQRGLILRYEKNIAELMDRVMSQNFQEFKTFQVPEGSDPNEEYVEVEDEELAGEEVEMSNG